MSWHYYFFQHLKIVGKKWRTLNCSYGKVSYTRKSVYECIQFLAKNETNFRRRNMITATLHFQNKFWIFFMDIQISTFTFRSAYKIIILSSLERSGFQRDHLIEFLSETLEILPLPK